MNDDAAANDLFGMLFRPQNKGFAGNEGHNKMHLNGCACDSCEKIWKSYQPKPEKLMINNPRLFDETK